MLTTEIHQIPLHLIDVNPYQARRIFDYEGLNELKESIEQHGVLQPLVARQVGGRFQLIAGERRLRASKMAGLLKVPVILRETRAKDSAVLCLMENLQRKDLNPVEEAEAYNRLMFEHGFTQETLAQSLGKSRSSIANQLRLLELPPAIQAKLREGALTLGHAKVLMTLKNDPGAMEAISKEVVNKGLTIKETEALIHHPDPAPPLSPSRSELTPLERKQVFEEKLAALLKKYYPGKASLSQNKNTWIIQINTEDTP